MDDNLALQRRIRACFAGTIERNCRTCQAYHTRENRCCFGHRFDPNDFDECANCIHNGACGMETEDYHRGYRRPATATQRPSRSINISRSPSRVEPAPPRNAQRSIPLTVEYDSSGREWVGEGNIPNTPFWGFMKKSVWKGLEGFFLGGAEFFKSTRLR